ncbi:MAG TPA: hypothetical protein VI815_02925 [Candidatus Nanoarchaeia archaeon]|nr:hypothetical protein [Candidatus Nanoarchaeia archaeon]
MKKSKLLKLIVKKACENNTLLDEDDLLCDIDDHHSHIPLIFSHDFAKAFWGTNLHDTTKYGEQGLQFTEQEWEYHLKKMVLYKDPIKYLEQFL